MNTLELEFENNRLKSNLISQTQRSLEGSIQLESIKKSFDGIQFNLIDSIKAMDKEDLKVMYPLIDNLIDHLSEEGRKKVMEIVNKVS